MTALELITNSRAILDESVAGLYSAPEILMWINEAERDIAAKTGCIETISTLTTSPTVRYVAFTGDRVNTVELVLAGTSTVLVSGEVNFKDTSDAIWQDTNDVIWKDYQKALSIPYSPFADLRITPHHFGHVSKRGETKPQYWLQWGNYIFIEPVPDDAYTLNAYISISPTDQISDNADVPEIPLEFQEAIIPYVVSMGFFKANQYSDGAQYYMEYISLVQDMINKHITRKVSRMEDLRLPNERKNR
jgi:hypothetical protein